MLFTDNEKKFLKSIGRTPVGSDLVAILNRAKQEYSSISSIKSGEDYGAQVEGRKLFVSFLDKLTAEITIQKHSVRPIEHDDYT
jgi:hypothetical protein